MADNRLFLLHVPTGETYPLFQTLACQYAMTADPDAITKWMDDCWLESEISGHCFDGEWSIVTENQQSLSSVG